MKDTIEKMGRKTYGLAEHPRPERVPAGLRRVDACRAVHVEDQVWVGGSPTNTA